jgi:tetratricopeptide (TPR) repeat protein
MRSLRLFAVALAIAAVSAPARAQSDASIEEAKKYAAQAKVHYDLGEYDAAAEAYIKVYRIKPLPALLYNIAQSYRQAGQYEKAKQFYEAYLREDPEPATKKVVQRAIKEIEQLLAKQKRAREIPPTGVAQTAPVGAATTAAKPPVGPAAGASAGAVATLTPERTTAIESSRPPASNPPVAQGRPPGSVTPVEAVSAQRIPASPKRKYAYISAGAAAVFLGAGALFTMRGNNYANELYARPHPQATADDLMSTAKSSHLLGAVFLGAGAAAAIGAGVLYFWPTGDGVAVQGRF